MECVESNNRSKSGKLVDFKNPRARPALNSVQVNLTLRITSQMLFYSLVHAENVDL